MRIGLNLLHAHPGIGGGWNYIQSIVNALAAGKNDHQYLAYHTRHSGVLVPDEPRFIRRPVAVDGQNRYARIAVEQAWLQAAAAREGIQCMHWFAANAPLLGGVPVAATIYDLKPVLEPETYGLAYRLYLQTMMRFASRRADVVMPISETTAHLLTELLGVPEARMVVVPFALGEVFRRSVPEAMAAFRAKYGLPEQFWLYVAHYYPHKNHERLFQAYARLRTTGAPAWPLVLRGSKNGAEELLAGWVAANGLQEHVIWLPALEMDEMPVLFSAATALVYPSLAEGCGIPVVEAMACGCPVVASDIPTTREFAGPAALMFDPTDTDGIAQAMHHMAADALVREQFAARGLAQAEYYRMERATAALEQAYAQAVSAAGR
jgi:glycosyltransferase involved in cell wall biosynthesis